MHQNEKNIELLRSAKFKDFTNTIKLFTLARQGDFVEMRRLIENGAHTDLQDEEGHDFIYYARQVDSVETKKLLEDIESGKLGNNHSK